MAGGVERTLRRRIRTVEATKKITRAMELIAASQIARAQARITSTRPYVEGMQRIVRVTAFEAPGVTRLVGEPESSERAMLVAIVGDRGLSGAYNSSVLRATERRIGEGAAGSYDIVSIGRKAVGYLRFRGLGVARSFTQMSDRPSYDDARSVARVLVEPFLSGEVGLVELVSTRYLSAGTQRVERRQLLPLPLPSEEELTRARAERADRPHRGAEGGFYDFEPEPEVLLELLVPQYVEAEIYLAMLEAAASEHTARQRAMAAATENAEELIKTYRRAMNRARQDSITTEIMEIVGGAEALRETSDGESPTEIAISEEQNA